MLYSEYVNACEVAVRQYYAPGWSVNNQDDAVAALRPWYDIACRLYVMPRFDDMFHGCGDRHVRLVRWMLDNQRIVLRYRRLLLVHERIIKDYTEACELQHAAAIKIAAMQATYPALGRSHGVTYWRL